MRSPVLAALFHPLNIAMAGVTIFAGLLSAWWLFPVGVVFWVLMVVAVSRDRALQLNAQMQRREPLAQRFQAYFDRIARAQVSIFNALTDAPSRTRRVLKPIEDEVSELTDEVYALCRRMTTLENYRIVAKTQSGLEDDLKRFDEWIEKAQDPLLRQEYEATRRSLQERLDKFQEVTTQLDRVEAQLVGLEAYLNGVVTEIVRLQAAGPEAAAPLVPDLQRRLQQEMEALQLFDQQATRF